MAADGFSSRLPFDDAYEPARAGRHPAIDADESSAIGVAAATLAGLPGASSRRLHMLLEQFGDATRALDAVLDGRAGEAFCDDRNRDFVARRWAQCADPITVALTLRRRSTRVWVTGRPDFPIDPELPQAPAVLLAEGERLTEEQVARVLSFSSNAVLQTKTVIVNGSVAEA